MAGKLGMAMVSQAFGMLAATLALINSSPAPAAPSDASVVLQPAGKWQVDYGLTECRLLRSFGDPAHPTTIQFAKVDPDRDVAPTFSLMSDKLKPRHAEIKVSIKAEGSAAHYTMTGLVLSAAQTSPAVLYVQSAGELADLLLADIAGDRTSIISLTLLGTEATIALGKMASPLSALNSCTDDLLRGWGYNPEEQRSIIQKPLPATSPGTWFMSTDYPTDLANALKTGGVFARLDINERGEITGCHTMEAGGDAKFQALTCALAQKKGRFTPAIAKSGKPIATYYPLRVTWSVSQ